MAAPGHIESLITRFWLNNGKLAENYFQDVPLLTALYKGKKSINRGYDLVQRITNGKADFKWYSRLDTLDRTEADFATEAKWDWKHAMASIVIAGTDMRRANTKEDMLSLVDSTMENCINTGKAEFNKALFLSTSTGAYAKAPEGFAIKFDAGTTACGDLDSTEVALWAPQRSTGGIAITTDATLLAFKKAMIDDVVDNASPGARPDVIVTTRAVANKIALIGLGKVNIVQPSDKVSGGKKYADLGFSGVSLDGVPVIVDTDCPAGCAYSFNSENNMKLLIHPDANFSPLGGDDGKKVKLLRLPNQDAYAIDLVLQCQLVIKERRALGFASSVS